MEKTLSEPWPQVVIVGAGFGGLQVARALRRAPVRLTTVIDRRNHYLFQPLLYQVATADLSPADMSAPIRSVLRRQRNTEVLLGNRSVAYEYLVLSTGAQHSYFGHDAWECFAPGLKTLTDATAIRRQILLAFEEGS